MSITYFAPEGTPKEYRTVSERLPLFLEAFPLTEGYAIVREHENCTHALWQAAIEAGQKPAEMGLGDPERPKVVFRCKLVKDGHVILNASAHKTVAVAKDWEAGETASFQRLMAAAGFGGEVMDDDDRYDRISSGLQRRDENAQPTGNDIPPAPAAEPERQPEPTPQPGPEQTPTPGGESVQPQQVTDNAVRPQLLNQLRQMAALAGEQAPNVASDDEAKKEIKRLRDKTRHAS